MPKTDSGISTDFINAKLRGMRSKLFESDRLLALADSRTLPELFRRIYPHDVFTGHLQFERQLLEDHLQQLAMIGQLTPGEVANLFECLLAHYRLENVKVALRIVLLKQDRADVENRIVPLPGWIELPLEELLQARDLRGFARALPDPDLRRLLTERLRKSEAPDVFEVEMLLDRAYLDKLGSLGAHMGGWVSRLIGFDVTLHIVLLLLRSKFGYERSHTEIEEFMVRSQRYLTRTTCSAIASAGSLAEAIDRIPRSCLPNEYRTGLSTLQDVEDAFYLRQYRLASQGFSESSLDVALIVAYCYIKRAELANLVRLTECIRHSLPREGIVERLMLLKD